jgi:putative ABC transport system permease protein
VGVVADVRDAGLEREPSMYVPVAQLSDWMNTRNNRLRPIIWTIRTDGTQPLPVGRIQQELASLSGGQPLGRPRTMHEAIAASFARTQFYMTLLTVFAGIALILTASGLYGRMTYIFGASAYRRTRDSGCIRSDSGRSPADGRHAGVPADALGDCNGNPLS